MVRGAAAEWITSGRITARSCVSAAPQPSRTRATRVSWRAPARSGRTVPGCRPPPRRGEPGVEQRSGDGGDHPRFLRGGLDASLPAERREIPAADLHGHAARQELPGAQACAGLVGEPGDLGAQPGVVGDVDVEGLLGTDLLLVAVGHDRTVVDAGGPLLHAFRVAAEDRTQLRGTGHAQLAERADAEARTSSGRTTTRPSGLRRSEAILATSLLGATPTDAVSPVRSRTRRLISRATCSPSPSERMPAVTSRNASSTTRPRSARCVAARRPHRDSVAAPRARASPSARRSGVPRSSPRPRRRDPRCRRRSPAGRAATDRRAARPTRRRRPCRRAGWRGRPWAPRIRPARPRVPGIRSRPRRETGDNHQPIAPRCAFRQRILP